MAKMLYGWNDGKFEKEYLRETGKIKVSFSSRETLKRGVILESKIVDLTFFIFYFNFNFCHDMLDLLYFIFILFLFYFSFSFISWTTKRYVTMVT